MKLFEIFGIKIKINYTLIPIWIISIYYQYFFELIIVMMIIMIHELAHSFASAYYGIEVLEIELFPFGGVARTESFFEVDPFKEIIISIVGPSSNYIMLLLAIIIQSYIKLQIDLIYFFIFTNLTIGLFNMLPILPLDGGRILRAYINSKVGFKKATMIMIKISKILSLLLFFTSIHLGIRREEYFFLCGIAIYLFIKANKEKEVIGYTFIYHVVMKKKQLLDKGFMEVKHLTALESIHINKVFHEFSSNKYHFITVINPKGKVLGNLSESEILDANIKYNNKLTLGELIEVLEK
ncbi:stage IV sporulation protein FB [Anaerovirgula multivorans]|uniref:Stage IV sporulation protein FB n=1 Tax=Anaerovirgula multivorans TaxID=312168 RepID=A0A239DTM2_9FIRM|nr:M50 family metallopeptidase [Anaerovirgula multivorans]SNS35052.1 stage IV sporulation protein FB [Anaerovirgula multivorans]